MKSESCFVWKKMGVAHLTQWLNLPRSPLLTAHFICVCMMHQVGRVSYFMSDLIIRQYNLYTYWILNSLTNAKEGQIRWSNIGVFTQQDYYGLQCSNSITVLSYCTGTYTQKLQRCSFKVAPLPPWSTFAGTSNRVLMYMKEIQARPWQWNYFKGTALLLLYR